MAVLLQFNGSSLAPSTVATNVTGGSLRIDTPSTMDSITAGNLTYASDPAYAVLPDSTATSAATSVTNECYVVFSITPASGYSLSLTTLTFNAARGGTGTPRGYDVRSSADAYAATLGTADLATVRPTFTAVSINLSAAAFQNVAGTLTFRIYAYAPSNVNSIDFDDFVINGTVAASGTVEQEGFIFRNDNGTQITATALAAQDVNIIQPKATNTRLRVLLNSTLDRGTEQFRLEYRKVGDSTWEVMS